MATARRAATVRARWQRAVWEFHAEQAEAAPSESWYKVWFQAGEDADGEGHPHIDFHVLRAPNPDAARCTVERHERAVARALGPHSMCSPDSIHAISVDILPDHCPCGAVDG